MSHQSGLANTLGNSASSHRCASPSTVAAVTSWLAKLDISPNAEQVRTTSTNSAGPKTTAAVTSWLANLDTVSNTGPDRLTTLPAGLLQQVASNLSAHSILALRTMNKTAAAHTFPNFVQTCLHSLTIETTKAGVKQALECLQTQGASQATTHVIFTSPPTANCQQSQEQIACR
jgi:hypothetical protein